MVTKGIDMSIVIIPAHLDLRTTLLSEISITPEIRLQTWLTYSWPAQVKHGAGKLTNVQIKQVLIMHDKQYQLNLIEED